MPDQPEERRQMAKAAETLAGIRAALDAFRSRSETRRKRPAPVEEEDALFIG